MISLQTSRMILKLCAGWQSCRVAASVAS